MHAVLHAHNWHIKDNWHIAIDLEGILFPEDNCRRLSPIGNWIHNFNHKRPPKDTYFIFLRQCNKKWNQSDSSHFAEKYISASLANFTIFPMLPQIQNKNILPQKITIPPISDPRLEPAVQPLRVKTLTSSPTPTPRLKISIPPSLETYANPWIEKFAKNKRIS